MARGKRVVLLTAVHLLGCSSSARTTPSAAPPPAIVAAPVEPDVPLAAVDPLPRGDVTLRDPAGVFLGSIDLDGDVFDRVHAPVGHLDVDGTVRTASFAQLGTAREDGTLVDVNAEPLLHVDDDGTIRSPSFAAIGRIQDDGVVRDVTAKMVAKVENYKPTLRVEVAAFVEFFARDAIVLQRK